MWLYRICATKPFLSSLTEKKRVSMTISGDVLSYDDERSSHFILRYDSIVQRYLRRDIGHCMNLSSERPITSSTVVDLRFCSFFFCWWRKTRFKIAISTGIFWIFFDPFSMSRVSIIKTLFQAPKFLWLEQRKPSISGYEHIDIVWSFSNLCGMGKDQVIDQTPKRMYRLLALSSREK